MPETREDLERQLHAHHEEKLRNEAAIQETRALLEKADRKRRENPGERQKWNAKLDELEKTLSQKKQLLTASETHIQQIQRKLEAGQYYTPGEEPAEPEPAPPPEPGLSDETLPENITLDDLQRAVDRVLKKHLVQIHTVSDLDYRMARALLGSRAVSRLSAEQTLELRKRVKMLDKTRGGIKKNMSRPDAEPEEPGAEDESNPKKELLKSAVTKCASQDHDSLTLAEVKVLVKYSKVLEQKKPGSEEEARVLEALQAITGQFRETGLV